jgi:hypothetical protein
MKAESVSTIAVNPSALVRESAEAFLRRPGAAPWLARLALPDQVVLDLGSEKTRLVLRPTCTGMANTADLLAKLAPTCEAFALASVGPGLLLVERSLAGHMLSAVARLPLFASDTPLSRIERGVVGGLAAALLAKLGLSVGIQVEKAAAPPARSEVVCIRTLVGLPSVEGQAWLCATVDGMEGWWRMSRVSLAPMILRLELARTRLPRTEVMAAACGDLVVFDEIAALSASSTWALALCLGGRRVHVRLDPEGAVLAGEATDTTRRIRAPSNAGATGEAVEITAEIAWSGDSAADALPRPRGSGVLMSVGESDWAEGALAEHDGRLAVRLTRMTKSTAAG